MATLQPIYTRDNCSFCAPLRWGLTVFWRAPIAGMPWLADLTRALDTDGIRLLGHRLSSITTRWPILARTRCWNAFK
jgi:hypothetical protein